MTMVAVSMETAKMTPISKFCSGKTAAKPTGGEGDGDGDGEGKMVG